MRTFEDFKTRAFLNPIVRYEYEKLIDRKDYKLFDKTLLYTRIITDIMKHFEDHIFEVEEMYKCLKEDFEDIMNKRDIIQHKLDEVIHDHENIVQIYTQLAADYDELNRQLTVSRKHVKKLEKTIEQLYDERSNEDE